MMMPATIAPKMESSPPTITTGNTMMPKECRTSKFNPVILPMMPPAAAALKPAVAQARPNTLGTEMPMDMEAN